MTTDDRRLAAIMFTDIVGYTSLMADDEQAALNIVAQQRDTLRPVIESHGGQWLKEMGDGTLSSFSSATSAVQCAIEVQQQLKQYVSFKVRIGVHLGDVVFTDTDVFGDGVNIASRIEPNAEPGGIAISGSVYDTLSNNKHFQTVLLGEKTLKNVGRPLRIYAISNDGLPVGPTFAATAINTDKSPSFFQLSITRSKPLIVPTAAIAILIFVSLLFVRPQLSALNQDSNNSFAEVPEVQLLNSDELIEPANNQAPEAIDDASVAAELNATEITNTGISNQISAANAQTSTATLETEELIDGAIEHAAKGKEENSEGTQIVLSEPAFVSPTQPGLVIASDSIPVQTLNTTVKPPTAVLESPIENN